MAVFKDFGSIHRDIDTCDDTHYPAAQNAFRLCTFVYLRAIVTITSGAVYRRRKCSHCVYVEAFTLKRPSGTDCGLVYIHGGWFSSESRRGVCRIAKHRFQNSYTRHLFCQWEGEGNVLPQKRRDIKTFCCVVPYKRWSWERERERRESVRIEVWLHDLEPIVWRLRLGIGRESGTIGDAQRERERERRKGRATI